MSQCHDLYDGDTKASEEEDHLISVHLVRANKRIKARATMTEGLVHLSGSGEAFEQRDSDQAGSAIADALTALAVQLRGLH
jgi:hypothetical protein